MRAVISNKITVYNPTYELREWARNNLTVTNPKWQTLMRIGKQDQIGYYHIQKDLKLYVENGFKLILPFGCLYAIWKYLKDCDIDTNFNNSGSLQCQNNVITQPLYDYQEEVVEKALNSRGGVVVAPCSAGKTNIMIELIHRIGKKFLFLVHTSDLLRQFYSRAKSLYPNMDIGQITDGKCEIGKDGAVATIQTMDRLDKDLYVGEFDVVICDECVHVSGSPTLSKMFSRVIESIPARYKYGCTATPERSDGMIKSMYAILGTNERGEFAPICVIDRSKTKSLTAEHIRVDTNIPFSYEFLGDDGTFDYAKLINYLSFDTNRNELIVAKTKELVNDKRKTILLCHRVEQCEQLNEKLCKNGIKSVVLVGKLTNKKRAEILNEKIEWDCIVGTYSLAKEGLDLPCLEAEILCTPVNDKGMTIQCVGRVERFKEGKRTPIVLDMCDEKIPYCVNRFKKRERYLKNR